MWRLINSRAHGLSIFSFCKHITREENPNPVTYTVVGCTQHLVSSSRFDYHLNRFHILLGHCSFYKKKILVCMPPKPAVILYSHSP